jgi:transglutaminase-like putative cysteine protease
MGPEGPREAIQRAIEHTGCRVRHDAARGGMLLIDCPTYEARAQLVDVFAWRDAFHDGALRLLALELAHDLPAFADEAIARRIHARVRDRVRFIKEAGDCIQDPLVTWGYAAGDCDCSTRLVLALCRSLGVQVELVAFLVRAEGAGGDEVRHACPAWQRAPGELVWMETTLPGAQFGEHPVTAARRLFARDRPDLR